MNEEEKIQLENECLLKYSKAQMIQKYIDELEENCTLSDLWCKSQEENKELKNKIEVYKNANEYHQNIIHEIETIKQPNQLHSENVKLRAENNRLNNIIKEAINYIDDNTYYKGHKGHINIDDLYIILQKGSESNE